MSLTRKMLTAMGIESEKIDQIIEAHTETTDALKAKTDEVQAKLDEAKKRSAKVTELEKQIEEMEAAQKSDEDWQGKYNEAVADKDKLQVKLDKMKAEYDEFKEKVEVDKANEEKLSLYKALLRDIGLDEKRVDKAARLKSLDELTVEDGKLAGYDELKASEAEEWAEFIPKTSTHGANVPNPPKTEPAADQPNERAVQIAKERHEKLYGKSEE